MTLSPHLLTYLNFTVVGYFLLLWILYQWDIQQGAISFIAELLTIPMILAMVVLLVLSSRVLVGGNKTRGLQISFVAGLVTAILIVLSFVL